MSTQKLHRHALWLILAGAVVLLAGFTAAYPVSAEPSRQETEKYCLSCHGDSNLSLTLPGGEKLSLFVSQDQLDRSVHSNKGIECKACHTGITTYPHPKTEYLAARELSLNYYQTCEKCHSTIYERTQDSMHAQAAAEGNSDAPVCTDCHGHHDTQAPDEPRSLISVTCGECHGEIVDTYTQSIHGAALIDEDNTDVPVCTGCHGVHNIQDPRTDLFRVQSPELCAGCHADAELMDKYGLSPDVYSIYKHSWHGVDISVYKARWGAVWHDSAVCTDCHGIHDIRKTDDPASRVNPDNLLETCRQCHPFAGPNWTDAWTGHYEISLERTPFLYYVEQFYSFFTPFVLWICIFYVFLQIVHSIVDRARSTLK
jgi:predicted CXXCH cytochrome family protein